MLDLEQKEELIIEILVGCFEKYEHGPNTLDEVISEGSQLLLALFIKTI
ncbi:hypothetical protein LEP1GSC034_3847 [Leptospira interrogans str. 2003000735]|uniref:Uncharacterized protein n=1 Tax=Leptospira interrogans str. 2002000626 TaxID=996803 RepID=A0A829D2M2_LEPIR|nr:hypothetical protein [Leptospira interrogans]EMJ67073.1 hypothetical protein LEP1GSC034_3847 [Leptospira interrogans str. 2003000735]EMJ67726.1 hypothetical protein LEP1GSC033_3308 [Leptospira interrogans str. 2002000632]EMY05323.1 hypothetical protein LEP1GSC029_3380 [Leptospira interrogans str. 2002000626]EKN88902.1 hypothetical protein LEP1GSC027_4194 [Leptospira interrogans str. 2002000624]EKQ36313.1 hypothetical protein LEP1GSC025_0771 [Leptospira interrogans str. 2002000621]